MNSKIDIREFAMKPFWTKEETMAFFNLGINQAMKVRQVARDQYGGSCKYNSHLVKRDSLLQAMGCPEQLEVIKAVYGGANE